ncbi:mRNA cleavage factor complex component Pcf11 [Histoplasma capsulatum var. duboisii H88]|uniref:mRNA cleavage factor complex component Pcf11 n=1 Tax=Ajellomyces capsulatus (strain H88) TaxID=544711 RepID=A0A8A1LQN2_AJEC8|nr:mRNA cleavage factor complex component Pcf11 [Histoplasma capsulatum var. duboisii H88]
MLLSKLGQLRFRISRPGSSRISSGGIVALLRLQPLLHGETLQLRRKFPHDIPNPPIKLPPSNTQLMGSSPIFQLKRPSHTDNHPKT